MPPPTFNSLQKIALSLNMLWVIPNTQQLLRLLRTLKRRCPWKKKAFRMLHSKVYKL